MLHLQSWQVHYTHAVAEASYDCALILYRPRRFINHLLTYLHFYTFVPLQAMHIAGFYVFTMSRCPNVLCQHRHFFASHKYWRDFDETYGR